MSNVVVADRAYAAMSEVIALWRRHSDTLGFLPEGAFYEYASRGSLLVCVDSAGRPIGYLLYRLARERAVIVHLVVGEHHRGQGVARKLFESFRLRTKDCLGAFLTCRLDFPANFLWPRLGFAPVAEREAKAEDRRLVSWWYNYGRPTLFSSVPASGPVVVIDSSVFIDLATPELETSAESCALTAPWISPAFELCVTPELLVELHRHPGTQTRESRRRFAARFRELEVSHAEADYFETLVTEILGAPRNENQKSDRRQLAYAIAAGVPTFVTRDHFLLDASAELFGAFGITVSRPVDVINASDIALRAHAYDPARLDGTGLAQALLRAQEIDEIVARFHEFGAGETKNGLPAILREAIARPELLRATVFRDVSGNALAVRVTGQRLDNQYSLKLLRVSRDRLGFALANHILWHAVREAADARCAWVLVRDQHVTDQTEAALRNLGFLPTLSGWRKPLLFGVKTLIETQAELATLGREDSSFVLAMNATLGQSVGVAMATELERLSWPREVSDAGLPCFVVPIRPQWATALFETRMASEELFHADSELLMRYENVYYRAASPRVLRSPGRILWYVSARHRYSLGGTVCAASVLSHEEVAEPKALYRRFRRFGVFTYDLVAAAANKHALAMAFTFGRTELLPNPIPFRDAQQMIFSATSKRPSFPGPLEVSEQLWLQMYARGMRS